MLCFNLFFRNQVQFAIPACSFRIQGGAQLNSLTRGGSLTKAKEYYIDKHAQAGVADLACSQT
jgi:hypothetical protein